jgi:hypothetical protein
MRIWIEGRGSLTLRKRDFLASGGEGSIYVREGRAYKVYADPGRVLDPQKISELVRIADERVIVPATTIRLGKRGPVVGYGMPLVTDTEPLGRLVPRSFKERHGIGPRQLLQLASELRQRFASVHAAGCLVVDASELNFLASASFDCVYAIDCDSYQTPSFPATAITPAIADPTLATQGPSTGSDWFAFAVLVFQLFTGMHPFRGKHPRVHGMGARMAQHLSAFDPEVRWPRATLPVDSIPSALRSWLEAVLARGTRSEPPAAFDAAMVVATSPPRPTVGWPAGSAKDAVGTKLLQDVGGNIRELVAVAGVRWLLADDGIYRQGERLADAPPIGARLALSPGGRGVLARIGLEGEVRLFDVANGVVIDIALRADQIALAAERLYLKRGDKILEVELVDVGAHTIATPRLAAQVMPHATRLFDGVAVQNMLGASYVSLFPRKGRHVQLHVPELDGGEVVAGVADGMVASLIEARGGELRRWLIRAETTGRYDVVGEPATSADPLPLVSLPSGVALRLRQDDALELFSAAVGARERRVLRSDCLGADWRLGRSDDKVLGIRGGRVYRMSLRRDEHAASQQAVRH